MLSTEENSRTLPNRMLPNAVDWSREVERWRTRLSKVNSTGRIGRVERSRTLASVRLHLTTFDNVRLLLCKVQFDCLPAFASVRIRQHSTSRTLAKSSSTVRERSAAFDQSNAVSVWRNFFIAYLGPCIAVWADLDFSDQILSNSIQVIRLHTSYPIWTNQMQ